VEIICPKHGSWLQTPSDHWKNHGCMGCRNEKLTKLKYDLKEIKNKCKQKYGDKYNYDNINEYKGITEDIEIECNYHKHKFITTFHYHISNRNGGCKMCHYDNVKNKLSKSLSDFIIDSKAIHGDKYNYSQTEYINNHTKVKIICYEHGEFYQNPNAHIGSKQGCPKCKESKGEKEVRRILKELNIEFETQKTFPGLIYKKAMRFDFYLPYYNIVIEYDGVQHFEPISWLHQNEKYNFNYQVIKDKIKDEYCRENQIPLLRIPYIEHNNIKDILVEFLTNLKI
jgi:hypothetical protein